MLESVHRVFIVDDDEAVRTALTMFMKAEGIPAEAYASATEFSSVVNDETSGVIIADVRMPGMNGLELQGYLNEKGIELPIVFITGHGDIPMVTQAMRQGAVDFIEKPFDNEKLLESINKSFNVLDENVAKRNALAAVDSKLGRLTNREREVMELLVAGNVNKEVARILEISTRTVEVHRINLMKKLEAKSLTDVVRLSISQHTSMPLTA